MYFLLKMGMISHCYVSLPDGIDLFVYLSLDSSAVTSWDPASLQYFFGGMKFSSGDKKLPTYIGTFLFAIIRITS